MVNFGGRAGFASLALLWPKGETGEAANQRLREGDALHPLPVLSSTMMRLPLPKILVMVPVLPLAACVVRKSFSPIQMKATH